MPDRPPEGQNREPSRPATPGPHEQAILSEQTAPNRTPTDLPDAIDDEAVAPGNEPSPLDRER